MVGVFAPAGASPLRSKAKVVRTMMEEKAFAFIVHLFN
jgi:hypothetical protein